MQERKDLENIGIHPILWWHVGTYCPNTGPTTDVQYKKICTRFSQKRRLKIDICRNCWKSVSIGLLLQRHIFKLKLQTSFSKMKIYLAQKCSLSVVGAYGVRTSDFFSSHCDDLGPFFLKKRNILWIIGTFTCFCRQDAKIRKKKRNTDAEFRDARLQFLLAQTTMGVFRRHKAQRSAKRRREESGTWRDARRFAGVNSSYLRPDWDPLCLLLANFVFGIYNPVLERSFFYDHQSLYCKEREICLDDQLPDFAISRLAMPFSTMRISIDTAPNPWKGWREIATSRCNHGCVKSGGAWIRIPWVYLEAASRDECQVERGRWRVQ
jgi:hypothetical protein